MSVTTINGETKLNEIKNLIKLASSCDGKAFGEFVREVIVPKNSQYRYNHISIWFKNKNDAEKFAFKGKVHFNFLELEKNVYSLFHEHSHLIHVKVFVSKTLPVNDFDINCLTYYYEGNNFYLDREILTIKVDLLVKSINDKTMLMFYNYGKNLDDSKREKIALYVEKGWRVRYNGQLL